MEIGTIVRCINADPLLGNTIAPPLEKGKEYPIKGVYLEKVADGRIFEHYDLGIVSECNYITSYDTNRELPDGDKIHWCHPSRFETI